MNIVFIHLGPADSGYLISNIRRFQELFPNLQVHLVVSQDSSIKGISSSITTHVYIPDERTETLFESLAHDVNFRQGFWRFSLERLFALRVVHSMDPLNPILHIESDILIMPNFPFDSLKRSDSLMWNIYNCDHDVSAMLFSPSFEETLKLEEAIIDKVNANPTLTDMTVLNAIWRENKLRVRHFSSTHEKLPELANVRAEPIDLNGTDFESGGIYDGAAIGMWLLGHDPKNNYGRSIIHSASVILNGNSFIDPRAINYYFSEGGELYAVSKKNPLIRIPIWNLHAHCKNNHLLSSGWESELRKFVDLSVTTDEISTMNWSIFRKMFTTSIKTGTFLRFLLGIPQLQSIRRKLSPVKKIFKDSRRATFMKRDKR